MNTTHRRKVKTRNNSLPIVTSSAANSSDSNYATSGKIRDETKFPLRKVLTLVILVVLIKSRFAILRFLQRFMVWYITCRSSNRENVILSVPQIGPNTLMDLVISHCDRNLDWIFKWAAPLSFQKITIYSKCNKPVIGAPISAKIIRMENVGRCDHTYAHFIAENYDQYHKTDDRHVLFLKDYDNFHRSTFSRHRSLPEMISIANEYGFSCHEQQAWAWRNGSTHLFPTICQVLNVCNYTELGNFVIKTYTRISRDENSEFTSQNGHSLGEYARNMGIESPSNDIVPICFGGNFMIQSKQIQTRPVEMWRRIERSLNRGNNIEEGHYSERLWAPLLARPLKQDTIGRILNQQKRLPCQLGEFSLTGQVSNSVTY